MSGTPGVIPAGKKDYTIVAVWQNKGANSDNNYQIIFNQMDTAAKCDGNYAGMKLEIQRFISWGCGDSGNGDFSGGGFNLKTPYISITRKNKHLAANNSDIYFNGQKFTDTKDTVKELSSDLIYIGKNSAGNYFNGYISEIIVFDRALAEYEITAIEQYLSSKYGIGIKLR